jgi:hypothetical protein
MENLTSKLWTKNGLLGWKFWSGKIPRFFIKIHSKLGLDSNLLLGSKNLKNKIKKREIRIGPANLLILANFQSSWRSKHVEPHSFGEVFKNPKHLAMALPNLNLQQQLISLLFFCFFFTPCLLYFVVAIIPRLDAQKWKPQGQGGGKNSPTLLGY